MQQHRSKTIFYLSICSVLLLNTVGCIPYRMGSFKGNASVNDGGLSSWPRYSFEFAQVPLDKPTEHEYTFRNVPHSHAKLEFELRPFSFRTQEKSVHALTTVLSTELREENGAIICTASGPISSWFMESSAHQAFLRKARCFDIRMKNGTSYKLTVRLVDIDPSSPAIAAVPIIRAGGHHWLGGEY